MGYIIREALPEDAEKMLEYLRIIGSETENLTFGEEGIEVTVEEEAKYIASIHESKDSIMYVAEKDGNIIGDASFAGSSRKRLRHRGELGIAVIQSQWGCGVGSKLMEKIIEFAKNSPYVEIISLEVRSDNIRAIQLYKKFGFQKIGHFKGFLKIENEDVDFDLMNLYL